VAPYAATEAWQDADCMDCQLLFDLEVAIVADREAERWATLLDRLD
jgi:hypothetical protein